MFTKWIINLKGLEKYRFAENGDLYRIPHTKEKKSFGWRLLKKQRGSRWRLNNNWWSKNQLKQHLEIDTNPMEILKTKDLPF